MGAPYGHTLNRWKTKILTSTTGASIFLYIPNDSTAVNLKSAINTYTTGEVTTGLKVLGLSLGSDTYFNIYLDDFVASVRNDTDKLFSTLPNTQTAVQLFSTCILQCTPFQLMVDVIANATPASASTPFTWTFPIATTIEEVTNAALITATKSSGLLAWSEDLAKLSESLLGLCVYTQYTAALVAFTISKATAI
eukprot:7992285-Ditylum_brightwellii.AAC.1